MQPDQHIEIVRPRIMLDLHPFGPRDLAAEINGLQQEVQRRGDSYCTKTLVSDHTLSSVLFAMRGGSRMRQERLGGSIHVLDGHLELHIGKHCGDVWDMLPYVIRNTEGGCSFFALDDDTIDLTVGTLITLEPEIIQDIEAIADSAFLHEVRTDIV
jgi:hypothetical protein